MASPPERTFIEIGERGDGSRIALPVMRWQRANGPRVFIGLSIHGDELTGHGSLWRLLDLLREEELHGSLTIIPLMNPEGFNAHVRGIPLQTVDLNRLYPGDPAGGFAERLTAAIWKEASQAEYIIDLHTAGWCLPFILLDPSEGALRERTERFAIATGVTVLDEFEHSAYTLQRLDGSLSGHAIRQGHPAFTFELGGYYGIDWNSVHAGFEGLRNALIHAGLLRGSPREIQGVFVLGEAGYQRFDVHASRGGLLEYVVGLGGRIRRGELIARTRNPFGDVVEEVVSPKDGYIIGLEGASMARTGGFVAELAVRKEDRAEPSGGPMHPWGQGAAPRAVRQSPDR